LSSAAAVIDPGQVVDAEQTVVARSVELGSDKVERLISGHANDALVLAAIGGKRRPNSPKDQGQIWLPGPDSNQRPTG
jgi:hypothetical protein